MTSLLRPLQTACYMGACPIRAPQTRNNEDTWGLPGKVITSTARLEECVTSSCCSVPTLFSLHTHSRPSLNMRPPVPSETFDGGKPHPTPPHPNPHQPTIHQYSPSNPNPLPASYNEPICLCTTAASTNNTPQFPYLGGFLPMLPPLKRSFKARQGKT